MKLIKKPTKRQTAIRNRRRGKAFQSKAAKILGLKNVGTLGGEDLYDKREVFSAEVKSLKRFAGQNIMNQAIAHAKNDLIPIAMVHINGQRHDNDLIMIRLKDWKNVVQECFQIYFEE